ncbi:hypothetical protein TNCV_1546241 [Trichonephila clavipes]|nr:hypothetical protein TNCV_1546241 [Trichonephila clavipes]
MYSAFAAWGTLNRRRAANPHLRLIKERWEALDYHQGVLSKLGGTEPNRTVSCMVLKAKANDRRKNLALRRDELRVLDMMLLSIMRHK